MGKYADRYLDVEPWGLRETGFHPDRSRVSESLFSQANEYMGVRASFEEGYSGDSLQGTYVNGIYETNRVAKSYKGISDCVSFMVNTLDWSWLRLEQGSEVLDLAHSRFKDFVRNLDFRTGLLTRSLIWQCSSGVDIRVSFERFLSMEKPELGYQRVSLEALGRPCVLKVSAGLDFSVKHESLGVSYWNCLAVAEAAQGASMLATSTGLGHRLHAAFVVQDLGPGSFVREEARAWRVFDLQLQAGTSKSFTKISSITAMKAGSIQGTPGDDKPPASPLRAPGFDTALAANKAYWATVWSQADIIIDGDPLNQQGIRFSIFQLEQTFRGLSRGNNIGAKGLSGEAYNGNAFWDSEVYCLPYYLYRSPQAARGLLDFRYATLPQALERAKALDCQGACFPVATIDGTESCTLWQHASLQFQPTSSVIYAIRHYLGATDDHDWFANRGAELMVQSARFLASRCQWSERKQAWGYYAVMGPDEFQMMVNHNCYTNYLGARSLAWSADMVTDLAERNPAAYDSLRQCTGLGDDEVAAWRAKAEAMHLPHDPVTGIYEQHEGFFDLPHVDIDAIPAEEFPLYHHWSYDRIYRNDMIKQPDVLMFMFLYNSSFSREEKLANYEYYEPRCIHESSLSPSVHSILAMELGKEDEALDFFQFATRIDLDNYNRNTREGLHLTAIAAAWMNIMYGFGGLRTDGDELSLAPRLAPSWKSWAFKLRLKGSLLNFIVDGSGVAVELLEGAPVVLRIYGKSRRIDEAQYLIRREAVGELAY